MARVLEVRLAPGEAHGGECSGAGVSRTAPEVNPTGLAAASLPAGDSEGEGDRPPRAGFLLRAALFFLAPAAHAAPAAPAAAAAPARAGRLGSASWESLARRAAAAARSAFLFFRFPLPSFCAAEGLPPDPRPAPSAAARRSPSSATFSESSAMRPLMISDHSIAISRVSPSDTRKASTLRSCSSAASRRACRSSARCSASRVKAAAASTCRCAAACSRAFAVASCSAMPPLARRTSSCSCSACA